MRRSESTRRGRLSTTQKSLEAADRSLISLLQRNPTRESVSPHAHIQSFIAKAFRTETPTLGARFYASPSPPRSFLTDTPCPDNLMPAMRRLQELTHSPKSPAPILTRREDFKYSSLLQDLEDARREMSLHFKDLDSLKNYVNSIKADIGRGKERNKRLMRKIYRKGALPDIKGLKRLDQD